MALTVIIDVETGVPQAIVNATELTAMRTGASGAIAARHLSPRQSVTLGVIGAGRQAEALVEATAAALTIEGILAWSRTEKSAEAFAARYADYNTRAVPIERACDCDVLFTTTPSEKPLVMADWVCEGRTSVLSVRMPPASRSWAPHSCSRRRSSSTILSRRSTQAR
jgi:alanine dehydrogenase